jgi:outer membrane protein OmpA-like peptidoglycan-associated protein
MDSNVGIARTGDLTRPAFDAHLGWDIRVSRTSRVDVGPFLGYTQIFQPNSELRSSDARILTAGLSVSLGATERARPAEPPSAEKPLPPQAPPPQMLVQEHDEIAEAVDICKDGAPPTEEGCGDGVRIFEDRLLLEDVVHFEFDSARIRRRSHRLVRNIARFIAEHDDIVDISIEGHADEVGSEEYNQKLSHARATSMKALLVSFGVDGSRLRVVARGKSRPRIVTLRPEIQNRRVELFVTRTRQELDVASSLERNPR